MSYASRKGYTGEVVLAEFLSKELGPYTFMRVGGPEKQKKVFGGDVVLNPRKCREVGKLVEDHVLYDYFLENKKMASINIWAHSDKARDDAKWFGKRGYILFVTLSKQGDVGKQPKRLVVMDWSVFTSMVRELQGYRDTESNG